MTTVFLKLALPLALLLALPLLVIRAQPYDDADLRAFLSPPDGCPAPCFMGIRPGVTTVEEAIAILDAHEWVSQVFYKDLGDTLNYRLQSVYWNWNEKVPDPFQTSHRSIAGQAGQISIVDDTVKSVTFASDFSLGEFLIALGPPEGFGLPFTITYIQGTMPPNWRPVEVSLRYWDADLQLHGSGQCSDFWVSAWNLSTVITLDSDVNELMADTASFPKTLIQNFHRHCQTQ